MPSGGADILLLSADSCPADLRIQIPTTVCNTTTSKLAHWRFARRAPFALTRWLALHDARPHAITRNREGVESFCCDEFLPELSFALLCEREAQMAVKDDHHDVGIAYAHSITL